MVDAGYRQTVEGNIAQEGGELLMHRLDRLEVVEMLGVDVGDDADLGWNLDEGSVGFIGLHNHPLPVSQAGVRAPIVDNAARDDGRILAAGPKQVGNERGRGGLAMRAG